MPAGPRTEGADCGVHICYIADERSTSARFLDSFAQSGLAKGERVLWLLDSRGSGPLGGLPDGARQGGDGAALGPVEVADSESAYLEGGSFDADRMLERYSEAVQTSRDAGFTGLRVIADVSWLAHHPSEIEEFAAYEARVNELFDQGGFAAVCRYDPTRLPIDWLRAIRDAHPLQAQPGGDTRISAGIFQVGPADDGGIAISGEIDYSNAAQVRALLAEHLIDVGDVRVDASRLRFVDVAGARALLDAALGMGGGRRLILRDAPHSLRVVLGVMQWTDTGALTLSGTREVGSDR